MLGCHSNACNSINYIFFYHWPYEKFVDSTIGSSKHFHGTVSASHVGCYSVYLVCLLYKASGAYEPPKAAKEHATYTVHRVPSQSKFKPHYYLISFLIWKVISRYLKPHKSNMPNTPSRSCSRLNRSARRRLKW